MTPIRHWPSIALITLGIGLVTMPHVTAYSGSTFIQGFELLKMCEGINDEGSATNTMAVGCAQFVIGVHDTMSSLTFGDLLDKGFVCFPE